MRRAYLAGDTADFAGALAAFMINIMSTRGQGPFSHDRDLTPSSLVVLTQLYVAVIVVVAMLIAQEAAARMNAIKDREAERRERLRLETLSRLALRLSGALTPEDIGKALEDQMLNQAGAQALVLGLISHDGRTMEWVTRSGYPEPLMELLGTGVPLAEPGFQVKATISNLDNNPAFFFGADMRTVYLGKQPLGYTQTLTNGGVGVSVNSGLIVDNNGIPNDDLESTIRGPVSTSLSNALSGLDGVSDWVLGKKGGKMISLATETDRTLFFDFLPLDLGTVRVTIADIALTL
jgi:hypothetical protein